MVSCVHWPYFATKMKACLKLEFMCRYSLQTVFCCCCNCTSPVELTAGIESLKSGNLSF